MYYVLVKWPESQYLMEHKRFHECLLVQDIDGHDEVGSSAYMCPQDLYNEILSTIMCSYFYEHDGYPTIASVVNDEKMTTRAYNVLITICGHLSLDPKRVSIKRFADIFDKTDVIKARNCGPKTIVDLNNFFLSKGIVWSAEKKNLLLPSGAF